MFWFGHEKDPAFDWTLEESWARLPELKQQLITLKTSEIIDLLDRLGKEDFTDAIPELVKESGFSFDETKKTLGLLPVLLKKESLERRIKAEFTKAEILDEFVKLPHTQTQVRAVPKGILLHVTAGNVFLSSIDSLIMGFLTKNISLLKVSSQNKFFPLYFAKKLKALDSLHLLADKFAILHWKGGDEHKEQFMKKKVDAIVAWGGEEMMASYQRNLPLDVKFIDFGPKISIQMISREGLANKDKRDISRAIVNDIVPWDQSACASPQNLYLQDGIDADELLLSIEEAFAEAPERGPLDDDEATEILKESYRGLYSELMEGGIVREGRNYLLHLEKSRLVKPSPLHRSLIIKRFKDEKDIRVILEPFAYYLQSCSYLLGEREKERYLNELCFTGLKRFAPLGTITFGMEGAPHDGRFVLRELVSFIGDEIRAISYGESRQEIHHSSSLKLHFENTSHPPGYIFSSGGTTGEPKYVHFSYEEFDYMTDMLAENFRCQGLLKGMTVANLFVAGNLWSSFLAVEKAMEKIGAIQLPIGGMCSPENVISYLKKFKPDAILGIPSLLVELAEFTSKRNLEITIPLVFYAGEALSKSRTEFLKRTWGTDYFGSAAYASVDAGVIGYQCRDCSPGEHHVFSDLIQLSIVDGEAVVTSIARDSMPVVNYRTGDRIEWITDCTCGRTDKRFRLLGRVDNVIQIWSCRILTTDIEICLAQFGILTWQLKIHEEFENQSVKDKLTLVFEQSRPVDEKSLLLDIYNRSRDLRDTIDLNTFLKNITIEPVKSIARNPRTGKISTVLDLRK
jgi:phenylacetate-CoA ligase